jgi:hypothetical protein
MFDLHVHPAPDVTDRAGDDIKIANSYLEAGFTGCVLKAHYDCTAGRARTASECADLAVFGGQALNQHVGGLNPAAVVAALAMGARVIWMPTADAHTQPAAGLPRLCDDYPDLAETSYAIPPVDWNTKEPVLQILRSIARVDAVLATGHLSAAEVAWLLPEARRVGVRRLLMTHPSYTVPNMSPAEAAYLAAEHGAYAEVTAFQLLHQPGCNAEKLARFIAAVGYRRVILSSDAGQTNSPPPPAALTLLIDELVDCGLDRDALVSCAGSNAESLVTPDRARA